MYKIKRGWSLLILFCVVTLFTACSFKQKKPEAGLIVLFNGTSSSGKTAIINELQRIFGTSYGVANLDNFFGLYQKNHPIPESEQKSMTPEKEKLLNQQRMDAWYSHSKKLSLQGKNVFVDTVQFDDDYEHYCSILGDEKVVKILVYCPLDVMVDRVQKRTAEGDPRSLNLGWSQFPAIYKLQESNDEVVVDRITTNRIKAKLPLVREEAKQIPKEAAMTEEQTEKFNTEREQFFIDFVKQFKLDTADEIVLVSKHPWDLIINTGNNTPEEGAQKIVDYLKKHGYNTEPIVFKTDPKLYGQYVGKYQAKEKNITGMITKENNKLFIQVKGQEKIELHPKAADIFFNQIDAFEITFIKDEKGKVFKLISHQDGEDLPAERMA